jgi:hypothetical protein
MEIKKIFVDPIFAKSILSSGNINNRRITDAVVKRYADVILKGEWKEDTFEPIKISKSGRLLDGQHRLLAIVKANIGLWMHVATGLNEDIFDVIDTGRKRTGGDVISMLGVKNGIMISAGIQFQRWIHGACSGARSPLLNTDIVDKYKQDADMWDEFSGMSQKLSKDFSRAISESWALGFLFLFGQIDKQDSIDFMNQLCSGRGATNNTIHLLRKRLIDSRMSSQYKLTEDVKAAFIIKTWNCFRRGYELGVLKYKPIDEKFPTPI